MSVLQILGDSIDKCRPIDVEGDSRRLLGIYLDSVGERTVLLLSASDKTLRISLPHELVLRIAANGDGDDVATTVWGAAKAALAKARGES